MRKQNRLWTDSRGSAIVEATVLFPIMIMIISGLFLLALYLPTRANLQKATQFAASALATEKSDSWLLYDAEKMQYKWALTDDELGPNRNVYRAFLRSTVMSKGGDESAVEKIVVNTEKEGIYLAVGELEVSYLVRNYVLYQEMCVTATRKIRSPVNLSFIGFPNEIPVTVTSSSIVLNGDEFVRNVDIAKDFTLYLSEKYNLNDMFASISTIAKKFNDFFGI